MKTLRLYEMGFLAARNSKGGGTWYILPRDLVPWILGSLLRRPESNVTALALAREKQP
jgi:ABC-type dipeptide/oligopeptide/nickel transport system permease subunit